MRGSLMTFDSRRAWSRGFDAAFCEIVLLKYGEIRTATPAEDMREATDLILVTAGGLTIQTRCRSQQYHPRYRYEYALRVPHELDAILGGYCDILVYGFAFNDAVPLMGLRAWTAINLDAFRAWYTPDQPYHPIVNPSPPHGRAYDWRHLPSAGVHHEADWQAVRLPV